ncbi:hypothetical protein BU16DRAFT_554175 [Lophium mytilinum]|uniref:Uncharacterized protein n=1 Tax=Lophium mytilinum TaxID=390894 RepID=A0A6A6RCB6_9PEZI|nr:hypothetical protein BU16DRAFT_554175 [Lophium mytilinum]
MPEAGPLPLLHVRVTTILPFEDFRYCHQFLVNPLTDLFESQASHPIPSTRPPDVPTKISLRADVTFASPSCGGKDALNEIELCLLGSGQKNETPNHGKSPCSILGKYKPTSQGRSKTMVASMEVSDETINLKIIFGYKSCFHLLASSEFTELRFDLPFGVIMICEYRRHQDEITTGDGSGETPFSLKRQELGVWKNSSFDRKWKA